VKRDLELLGVDENMALDRRRWIKIIARPSPYFTAYYGLQTKMINEND